MKKRRGVAAKVAATLVLALGGFTLAAVVSGVGFASGETTASTPSTDTTPTTTETTPTTTETTPTTTAPPEGEGCTPGFWKNLKQHGDFWTLDPESLVSELFTATAGTDAGAQTLIAALENGGGGVDALLRHAVAAVLNARAGLDFPFTEAEIIAAVNAAITGGDAATIEALKNDLDEANNLGCPFGNDGD
jgi:hypothetical protein